MPEEYRGQFKVNAQCETCGKSWYTKNAQGVGAKHARKYGHNVVVEVLKYYIYSHAEKKDENVSN